MFPLHTFQVQVDSKRESRITRNTALLPSLIFTLCGRDVSQVEIDERPVYLRNIVEKVVAKILIESALDDLPIRTVIQRDVISPLCPIVCPRMMPRLFIYFRIRIKKLLSNVKFVQLYRWVPFRFFRFRWWLRRFGLSRLF